MALLYIIKRREDKFKVNGVWHTWIDYDKVSTMMMMILIVVIVVLIIVVMVKRMVISISSPLAPYHYPFNLHTTLPPYLQPPPPLPIIHPPLISPSPFLFPCARTVPLFDRRFLCLWRCEDLHIGGLHGRYT